ncbi:MAG: RNA 2',3'-cyclic phosphodiesterase [Armatimonadetes bacterium]|nr:RNA 2',3'-cyclic phosphodiesterase [Armatimonadota bacterium]
MLRLFVAIEIPADVRGHMHQIQNKLGPAAESVRWVAADHFHLTLKFLGSTDPDRVAEITARLKNLAARHHGFELELLGVGAFPSAHKPRVLWVGTRGELAPLKKLARELDREMEAFGYKVEGRLFQGHLTLGRIKVPRVNPRLEKSLTALAGARIGRIQVQDFCLFQSELHRSGPIYHVLDRFRLQSQTFQGKLEEV